MCIYIQPQYWSVGGKQVDPIAHWSTTLVKWWAPDLVRELALKIKVESDRGKYPMLTFIHTRHIQTCKHILYRIHTKNKIKERCCISTRVLEDKIVMETVNVESIRICKQKIASNANKAYCEIRKHGYQSNSHLFLLYYQ